MRAFALPHRPPGRRKERVQSAVTKTERRKVQRVARRYQTDESKLLYFKSVEEILREHDTLFPKKAPAD